ncbi:telomere-associated protein RIF1-like isoform X2 [Cylas formicarius]|uniref:telomere-associated protein RIF1-like isoform X2 n=1 Tax=Cylas formicarius TaxID=197179 RepID=UPI0029588E4D|nr:telomere-associated protein RIF1-like isoform X2 [Cylas formicarius]
MDSPTENASKQIPTMDKVDAEVNLMEYKRQMRTVKTNLALKAERLLKTSSLKQLEVFINSNAYDVHNEVLSIINNVNIELWVKLHVINLVSAYLRTIICNYDLDSLAAVYLVWKDYDRDKFLKMLHQTCHEENNTICKTFFLVHLVPAIMQPSPTDYDKKGLLIDLAFMFVPCYPVTCWTEEEYEIFLANINKYIKNISDLRDANYAHWHRLWMFLVRVFGKKLHHSMSLVNRLLRVVESAFRNSSCEQRLKGYDCWKELIDNASLDKKHLSSSKQLRLLLTPLKAKFSKQESVIMKRFEVFGYLLEKLQSDSTLILKELLEFCFGDVSEHVDPTKVGHSKSVPQLRIESAKLLLAIIGHAHNEVEHCLSTDGEIRLNRPVVNTENFYKYYCYVIKSVDECCKLLRDVELEHRISVLQCFWQSTLNLIFKSSGNRLDSLNLLNNIIEENLMDNNPYSKSLVCLMFKAAMNIEKNLIQDFVIKNLNSLLKVIFSVPLRDHSYYASVLKFCDMIFTINELEEKSKIRSHIFRCFTDFKTIECNVYFVAEIWIRLASELDDRPKEKLDFLLWPALYLQHLQGYENLGIKVVENYGVLITKYVQKFEEIRIALFKGYKKLLRNNPLLSGNILKLVELFPTNFEDLEGTTVMFDIFSQILQVPSFIQGKEQKTIIECYLKAFLDQKSGFSTLAHPKSIESLCRCLRHLFENQQYDCLNNLERFVEVAPDPIKESILKLLSVPLTDMLKKETDLAKISQIDRLIRTLQDTKIAEPKEETEIPLAIGGRSAKIAKLAKNIPKSPMKRLDSSPLRLFGRDVDNFSSVNLKGSQLKNVTPTKKGTGSSTPNKMSKPSLMDESSSKFVSIKSEVKIVLENLTEHQKESLKKRREDIPALYEDLSQSQSRSLNSVIHLDENQDDFKQPQRLSKDHDDNTASKKDGAERKLLEELPNIPASSPNEDDKKKQLAKEKMRLELKKLELNIVGAEEFLSPSTKRKRKKKIFLRKSPRDSSKKKEKSTPDITSKKTSGHSSLKNKSVERDDVTPKETKNIVEPSQRDAKKNESTESKQKEKSTPDIPSKETSGCSSLKNKLVERDDVTPKEEKNIVEKSQRDAKKNESSTESKKKEKSTPDITSKETSGRFSLKNKLVERDDVTPKEKKNIVEKSQRDSKINESSTESKKKEKSTPDITSKKTSGCSSLKNKLVERDDVTPKEEKNIVEKSKRDAKKNESSTESKKKEKSTPDITSKETSGRFSLKNKLVERDDVTPKEKKIIVEKSQRDSKKNGSSTESKKKEKSTSDITSKKTSSRSSLKNELVERDDVTPKEEKIIVAKSQRDSKINESSTESKKSTPDITSKKTSGCSSLKNKLVERDEVTPKEGTKKRKRTSPKTESEDFIESSQETTLNNSIKAKSFIKRLDREGRSSLDQTLVKSSAKENSPSQTQSLFSQNLEAEPKNIENIAKIEETENQNTEQLNENVKNSTQSQDTQTQETETYEPDAAYDTQPKLDVPKKTELTKEQKVVSMMDTASLTFSKSDEPIEDPKLNPYWERENVMEIILGNLSPSKTKNNDSELTEKVVEGAKVVEENETASPVGSGRDALPSSPVTGDTPNKTSELLNSTSDISPITSKSGSDDENDTVKPFVPVALKFDDLVDTSGSQSPVKGDDVCAVSEMASEKNIQCAKGRSVDILAIDDDKVVNNISIRSSKFFSMVKSGSPMPPHRFINKRKSSTHMSPSALRIRKLMSGRKPKAATLSTSNMDKQDLLTFTREVPSPSATPRSSILKRKHSDVDDGFSPCPKRKRVNFSDPCTTSSKVFYKEETNLGEFFLLEPPLDIGVFDSDDTNENLTDTEVLETEQSLQITNMTILRNDRPIYPQLEDCDEDVSVIMGKVTSPMFINMLTNKLKNSGINTIGDLARQSEVEVNRFPFKTPIVANVFKALDNHFAKFCKRAGQVWRQESIERSSVNNGETVDGQVLHVEELKDVLEKMKTKEMTGKSLN